MRFFLLLDSVLQEKRLCSEIRILPALYLKMVQTMSVEVLSGKVTKKSDAYNLFKVDPNKVDKVYDMLVKKGIAQAWFYYLFYAFFVSNFLIDFLFYFGG